jgi:hypothetical protein
MLSCLVVVGQVPIHHIGKIVKLVKELGAPFCNDLLNGSNFGLLCLGSMGLLAHNALRNFFVELFEFRSISVAPSANVPTAVIATRIVRRS